MALGTTGSNARVDIVITIRDAAAVAKINKLTRAEQRSARALRRLTRSTRQAQRATGRFGSTIATLRKAIISMIGIMILWNGVIIPIELAFMALGKSIFYALSAVAKYGEQLIGLKAILATTVKFTEDFAENFRLAGTAADAVLKTFMRRTGEILGTTEDVLTVFQTLLATGGGALVGTVGELVEASILLNNAIITITPNQEKQRQLASETAALLRGQVRATDRLAKLLGLNATKSKALVAEMRKSKSLLEYLAVALKAFEEAGAEIELTWGAISSSYEEFFRLLSIDALGGSFKRMRDYAFDFLKYMNENAHLIELTLAPTAAAIEMSFRSIVRLLETLTSRTGKVSAAWDDFMLVLTMTVSILSDLIRMLGEFLMLITLGLGVVAHILGRIGVGSGKMEDLFGRFGGLLGILINLGETYEGHSALVLEIQKEINKLHEDLSDILDRNITGMRDLAMNAADVAKNVDSLVKNLDKLTAKFERAAISAEIAAAGGPAARAYGTLESRLAEIDVELNKNKDTIQYAETEGRRRILESFYNSVEQAYRAFGADMLKVQRDQAQTMFKYHVKVVQDVAQAQEKMIRETVQNQNRMLKNFISLSEKLVRENQQLRGDLFDAPPAEEINAEYGRMYRAVINSGYPEALTQRLLGLLDDWHGLQLEKLKQTMTKARDEAVASLKKIQESYKFDLAKSPGAGLGESGLPVGIDVEIEAMLKRSRVLLQKMRLEVKGVLPPNAFASASGQLIVFQKDIERVIEMARDFGDVMSQEMVDDIEKLVVAMQGIDAELARQVDAYAHHYQSVGQEFKTWMAKLGSDDTQFAVMEANAKALKQIISDVGISMNVDVSAALAAVDANLKSLEGELVNFGDVFVGVFKYIGEAALGALGQAFAQFITDIATGSEDALANIGQFIGNIIIMMGQLAVSLGTIAAIGSLIPGFEPIFGIGGAAGVALIAAGAAAIAVGAALGGGGSRSTSVATGGAAGAAEIPTFAFEQGNINVQQNLMGAVSGLSNATSSLNSTIHGLTSKSPGVLVNDGLSQLGGPLQVTKNAVNQAPSLGRGLGAALAGSGSTGGF